MKVTEYDIPGLKLIEPKRFGDARGWFAESWQVDRYREAGIEETFVQDNLARSSRGVLRGLHGQEPHPQGKMVFALEGTVYDVAVDVRVGSPTFGRWEAVKLDADHLQQFYIPPGCVHGYLVLSETALVAYKATDLYSPSTEFAVLWNDPTLNIQWPYDGDPLVSEKDSAAPLLADVPESRLTRFPA